MPNWSDAGAVRATHDGREAMRGEVLRILRAYLAAYPQTVFREPPDGCHCQTVDGCSARALRAVLPEIMKEVEEIGKDA